MKMREMARQIKISYHWKSTSQKDYTFQSTRIAAAGQGAMVGGSGRNQGLKHYMMTSQFNQPATFKIL